MSTSKALLSLREPCNALRIVSPSTFLQGSLLFLTIICFCSVILEGILLKPNMILPGLDVPTPAPEEVARYTVRTMFRSVPGAVPGMLAQLMLSFANCVRFCGSLAGNDWQIATGLKWNWQESIFCPEVWAKRRPLWICRLFRYFPLNRHIYFTWASSLENLDWRALFNPLASNSPHIDVVCFRAQAYGPTPWSLTFSYGRALQSSTLKMWAGQVRIVRSFHHFGLSLHRGFSKLH